MNKELADAKYVRSYVLGAVVTIVFFSLVVAVIILFAPKQSSFLTLWIFLLPLSPFFVVWLYILFWAIIPITGGMPGKGFKQWLYAYLFALSILVYLIGVAFVVDFLLPTFDRYYTEMIFPSAITIATLFVVLRIPRVNRFMWKVFGTDQKAHDAKQTE